MITAAGLIELLQQLPPDVRIVVSGYEGGYNDAQGLQPLNLALDYNDEEYYGAHENADSLRSMDVHVTGDVPAFYLFGGRGDAEGIVEAEDNDEREES